MSLAFSPAHELLSQLRDKKVSCVDIMKSTIERIWAVNDTVNAIVSMREEQDMISDAEKADNVAMEDRGPLHGLPIAIKDLANAKGFLTTQGSPIFADDMAQSDDIIVERIRNAGAIIIGKTNTPEFGLGSHTYNPVFGTTLNPYDQSRSAGGSSGGAAVALATGMLTLADGSDMMGSLRNPAAWNNVYGMRPTWGLVPSEPGDDVFLHALSTSGPMARNPKDIALLLSVMSGAHPKVPYSYSDPSLSDVTAMDLAGKRIGWLGNWGGAFPFERGLLEASHEAVLAFEALGAIVEEVAPPIESSHLWDSWTKLRSWKLAGGLGQHMSDAKMRDMLKPAVVWEIEHGLSLSALEVHNASILRTEWFVKAMELFDRYDALVLPSTQTWPFLADKPHPDEIDGIKLDTYHRWMEVVIPAGLLGLPVLNLPAGFGENGLPFGLQLFAPKGADSTLLSIGEAWHRAKNWPDLRRPTC